MDKGEISNKWNDVNYKEERAGFDGCYMKSYVNFHVL